MPLLSDQLLPVRSTSPHLKYGASTLVVVTSSSIEKKRISSDLSAELPAKLLRVNISPPSQSLLPHFAGPLAGTHLYLFNSFFSSRLILTLISSLSVILLSFYACSVSSLSCPVHSSASSLGFLDLLKTTNIIDLHFHLSDASVSLSAVLHKYFLPSCLTRITLQCNDLLRTRKLFSPTFSPHLFSNPTVRPRFRRSLIPHLTFAAFSRGPKSSNPHSITIPCHSQLFLHFVAPASRWRLLLRGSLFHSDPPFSLEAVLQSVIISICLAALIHLNFDVLAGRSTSLFFVCCFSLVSMGYI